MNDKEWTIMIYMAGDNNLSVDMAYAMEQIKGIAGEGADSPNLFVYYDGNSPSIPTLYCDFSDPHEPKYVRSFKVTDKIMDVPDKQNENAADTRSVINFVDWCVNKVQVTGVNGEITNGRRAAKYAVIFSGHTLGFQDIGLFRDESSGRAMKMNGLYYMLRRLTNTRDELIEDAKFIGYQGDEFDRETRLLLGQKIDLLGFDSCVMGMLEVGYQFGEVAKTMIASEGSVPNAGWTYAKILGCLTRGQDGYGGSDGVGEHFVRQFIESQDRFTVGGVSVDMAAWDLSRLTELAAMLDDLAAALIDCFDDPSQRIYKQMERAILQVHWKCQSYMYDQNVDIGDFCELLDRECSSLIEELGGDDVRILERVRVECRAVLDALKHAVILSGFSGGEYQYSNGISVFFPWSREGYEVSKKNYQSLFFVKDVQQGRKYTWTGFLKKYLYEVTLRTNEPFSPDDAAAGSKHRYSSGIKFHEVPHGALATASDATELAGEVDSKLAGERGSKLAGERGSKLAGEQGSKLAGEMGSKLAGELGSKLAGERGSKLAGEQGSKLAGEMGSKLAGERGSKLAGERGSKLAREQGSKLAGEMGSKLAGERGSKLAGERGSKLAGGSSGGGSSRFFDSLKLYKNIEGRWDISGFTKKAGNVAPTQQDAAE
ncbi:MAG: clostripain-related cysteine peptidase [Pyrinomonadaceae bacterium]